jgi:hypothetical protein
LSAVALREGGTFSSASPTTTCPFISIGSSLTVYSFQVIEGSYESEPHLTKLWASTDLSRVIRM